MTTKEKLKKALEAIASGDWRFAEYVSASQFAEGVLEDINKPRTETVEVVRYMIANPSGGVFSAVFMGAEGAKAKAEEIGYPDTPIIAMTGSYQRPIPEPEMWEGEVLESIGKGYGIITEVPYSWIGRRVVVEVI